MILENTLSINWTCRHTWLQASKNTSWCLLGCCIGDFGTIATFQYFEIDWPVFAIMSLAIFNGLITSILLETFILWRQMPLRAAFHTAIGMSLISMMKSIFLMMMIPQLVLSQSKHHVPHLEVTPPELRQFHHQRKTSRNIT